MNFEICGIYPTDEHEMVLFRLEREDGVLGSAKIDRESLIHLIKELHESHLSVNDWLIYWDDTEPFLPIVREEEL